MSIDAKSLQGVYFRSVAATATDAIISIDQNSTVLFANEAVRRIFGHRPEDLIGGPLSAIIPEDLRARHHHSLAHYLQTGVKRLSWEAVALPGRHATGRLIPLEISFSEFIHEGQRIFTGIIRDVSERRASEQRAGVMSDILHTVSETRELRAITDTALRSVCTRLGWDLGALWLVDSGSQRLRYSSGYASTDEVAPFLSANAAASLDRGVGLGGQVWALAGEPVWLESIADSTNFTRLEAVLRMKFKSAVAFAIVISREVVGVLEFFSREERTRDNDLVDFLRTVGAQIAHAIVHARADLEAQRAQERYRAFLRQTTEAVWRCELEVPVSCSLPVDEQVDSFYKYGVLAECNDAMARMYGVASCDQLQGARLGDLLVRSDPRNEEYLKAFIRAGYRLINAESHELDSDGQPLHIMNNLTGIIENGHLVRCWGTQRDITKEKAQLDELARTSRAKDEFLAILSHELRTPLTSIVGWASLLKSRTVSGEKVNLGLDTIFRNANAQSRLIDDLLDLSSIVTGNLQIRPGPVDLNAIVTAAAETVRFAAESKQITIQVNTPPDPATITGDAYRLQQVVWNLLSNAIKFTPDRGRVEVILESRPDAATIRVSDSGIGIEPDVLPLIFDRFFQADASTKRRYGGLGIGLAIARQLVELHGGTISAYSEGKGTGSTFTVKLPGISGAESSSHLRKQPA